MRTSLARPVSRLVARAGSARVLTFSTTARVSGDGDTAWSGMSQPDAIQQRKKAIEDYGIRQREMNKLLDLRKKIRQQQEHLQQLSTHIEELTKEQGGEQK